MRRAARQRRVDRRSASTSASSGDRIACCRRRCRMVVDRACHRRLVGIATAVCRRPTRDGLCLARHLCPPALVEPCCLLVLRLRARLAASPGLLRHVRALAREWLRRACPVDVPPDPAVVRLRFGTRCPVRADDARDAARRASGGLHPHCARKGLVRERGRPAARVPERAGAARNHADDGPRAGVREHDVRGDGVQHSTFRGSAAWPTARCRGRICRFCSGS